MDLEILILVAFAGAIGQLMDASAGMGFGVLSSSVMVAGGVAPGAAATTVNLAKVGSGLLSGAAHWRLGNVQWRWFLPLLLAGVAGAVTGGLLVTRLPREVVRLTAPCVLLGMSVLILQRVMFPTAWPRRVGGASDDAATIAAAPSRLAAQWRALSDVAARSALGVLGFLAGAINAMTGGYGPFATSALMLVKGGHPRYAVGTANMVEVFVAAASSVTLLLGVASKGFQWQLVAALVVGSLVTTPIGAYLARHMSPRPLMALVGLALLGINTWSIVRVVV